MRFLKSINLPISLISFLLVSIGILVIFSSSKELAIQQLIFTSVGIILFFLISRLELQSIKTLIKPLYILILLMLTAVLILGFETRGSLRWIPLGFFNVQPSEFAKPILILTLARFWSENPTSWLNIFKSLLWVVPYFILVFRQPDLGSALTLAAIWLGMLFVSHVPVKKILILGAVALIIIPASWLFLHDYQKARVLSFIAPESDPLGRGYNVIQSTIAVGSGELLGRGLGMGTQSRLQFLPEFRTDFIFASIGEEMGFIGAMLILLLYLSLIFYCFRVAQKTGDSFSLLVTVGVSSMLLFQAVVNMGMNVGLLPITGITLPLISYGGSSAVATLLSLGMVASCERKR